MRQLFHKKTIFNMPQIDLPPGTNPSSSSTKPLDALGEYCLKNPFLVLWNVALILGGLITFAHFMRIGYFPDLDVKSASAFLLGVALLGVSLMIMLAVTLVLPSYLIRTQVWNSYCLHEPIVSGPPAVRVSQELEKGRRLPFIAISFLHGSIAFCFWTLACSYFIPSIYEQYIKWVQRSCLGGLLVLLGGFLLLHRFYKEKSRKISVDIDTFLGHAYKAQHFQLICIWLAVYPGYFLLLSLAASKLQHDDIAGHSSLIAFALLFTFANASLAVASLDTPKRYWVIPVMAALLTIVYLNIPSNPLNITRAVFASLAIGDLDNTRFVVKRQTCDAVNMIAPGACRGTAETVGCIYPKTLANRIGTDYLLVLEVPNIPIRKNVSGATKSIVKIPVSKSDVVVWSVVVPNSQPEAGCGSIVQNDNIRR